MYVSCFVLPCFSSVNSDIWSSILQKSAQLFLNKMHSTVCSELQIMEISLKWASPASIRPESGQSWNNSRTCKQLHNFARLQVLKWNCCPASHLKTPGALLHRRLDPHTAPLSNTVLQRFSLFKALWQKWSWQMPLPICQNQEEFFSYFSYALFAA